MHITGPLKAVASAALIVTLAQTSPGRAEEGSVMLERARSLHHEAFVADLHADPLIWNRDLNKRSKKGHVDFPRLREAGVDLQVIGLPTLSPPFKWAFGLFCWWERWPRAARKELPGRADWMIDQLERFVRESGGSVGLVGDPLDLEHNSSRGILSTLLVIEGGQILEGSVENLDRYFQLGVRGIGISHFVPNDLGGATYKKKDRRRGLTDLGREVIRRANDLGIIIDLAHASERTIFDVLDMSSAPVMVSHTGLFGVHPHWRNISDDVLRAVAARGGIVGIIFQAGNFGPWFDDFLGGRSMDALVAHIMHGVKLVGSEHLALGSDFDGFISPPKGIEDVTDLPLVTAALMERGLSEDDLRLILGGNFRRLFRQVWDARRAE